ncbi:hypothetical protein DCC79_16430 [bacterium]|nr:MAG: hypothetical protein DCC79_16430 [bacterium]
MARSRSSPTALESTKAPETISDARSTRAARRSRGAGGGSVRMATDDTRRRHRTPFRQCGILSGMSTPPWVLPFDRITAASLPDVGGKGANLGELARAGFPIPPGFCVTTAAFDAFMAARAGDGVEDAGAATFAALDALAPGDVEGVRAVAPRGRPRAPGTPTRCAPAPPPKTCPTRRLPGSRTRTSTSAGTTRSSTPSGRAGRRCSPTGPSSTVPRTGSTTGTSSSRWWSSGWSIPRCRASCSPPIRSPATATSCRSTPASGWARRWCRGSCRPTSTASTPARIGSSTSRSATSRSRSARCRAAARSARRCPRRSATPGCSPTRRPWPWRASGAGSPRTTAGPKTWSGASTPPARCSSSSRARSRRCTRCPSRRRATTRCTCTSASATSR